MKFLDLETLNRGNERQQKAYAALQSLKLMEKLRDYTPVLAGTIPIDVDIESSDLDVICSAENLEAFAAKVEAEYGREEGYEIQHKVFRNQPTVLVRFRAHGFPVELFAQAASVFTQPAVVHMLIEARLLAFAPAEARQKIRLLKQAGLKTEPAFAEAFDIKGDPYEELLKIANKPDHEILMIAHRFLFMQQ